MTHRDIQFLRIRYLRGPNLWTYRPVVEAWVDIGALEDLPSNLIPGLYERLTAWLPGLIEHRCGPGVRGGFLMRVREGTWPAHIMEHVAIELQNLAGLQAGFGKARETSRRGVYKVAIRARNEEIGRAAIQAARDLVVAAINDTPFDPTATVAHLRDQIDRHHLGPSTECIVTAATQRRIPWIRLTRGNLVQIGHGAKQRRIWTAETDQTSAIAESISSDKDLTKRLLSACGIPVPGGEVARSPAEAWTIAQDLGLPVVIKPLDGNHGRGVVLDLTTQADIEAAWHLAHAHGSDVLVEHFIRGDEHRLLVVGDQVVAAARGEAAWIVGDGQHTVAQLIDLQINSDPRRGTTEDFPLNTLIIDNDEAIAHDLARQGLDGNSIPVAGRRVLIQRNGNVALDCTDDVHPDVAQQAVLAARVVGLDIAGIDLVAQDIGQPLQTQDGAIVEVNAGPGLLAHLKPANGAGRPVGEAIINHLFDPAETGRIPIVGVCGTREPALIARLVAWLIHMQGKPVGLACQTGLYLGARCIDVHPSAHWDAGQQLLMNRWIEAAVCENGPAMILTDGLPYDRCQIGIVTDVCTTPAMIEEDILDDEQAFKVVRTQVDVVLPEGAAILNADDPQVLELAPLCDGEVILYAADEHHPALKAHRAAGGRVVFTRETRIKFAHHDVETRVVDLAPLPLLRTHNTPARREALLAACAAAWALGLETELIAAGIETFGAAAPAAA